MERGNRPVGREKHVGSGTGDVSKRGDGTRKIENLSVGNRKHQMTYHLTDIYDKYSTPSI